MNKHVFNHDTITSKQVMSADKNVLVALLNDVFNVDVEAILKSNTNAVIAGQAVGSALATMFNMDQHGVCLPFNDLDVFIDEWLASQSRNIDTHPINLEYKSIRDITEKWHHFTTPDVSDFSIGKDAGVIAHGANALVMSNDHNTVYPNFLEQRIDKSAGGYSLVRTGRIGCLNVTLVRFISKNNERYVRNLTNRTKAERLIRSFDINSTQAGLVYNRKKGCIELIVTHDFIKWLNTRELSFCTMNTTGLSLVRLMTKFQEMKGCTVNRDLAVRQTVDWLNAHTRDNGAISSHEFTCIIGEANHRKFQGVSHLIPEIGIMPYVNFNRAKLYQFYPKIRHCEYNETLAKLVPASIFPKIEANLQSLSQRNTIKKVVHKELRAKADDRKAKITELKKFIRELVPHIKYRVPSIHTDNCPF